jgi:L-lactate dehydrogenase
MYQKPKTNAKVAIIGAGNVGATVAYTILMKNLVKEIHLVDINKDKCRGECMDLEDASGVENGTVVFESGFNSVREADVIIHTAGLARFANGSRLDLIEANRKITSDIFRKIGKLKKTAVIIVVANPVDCITKITREVAGVRPTQVIGTGTGLDTTRLHVILSEKLGVHPSDIEGFVLGEHGDSGFIAWSSVRVKGKTKSIDKKMKTKVAHEIRKRAQEIIKRKKATYYGIAMVATDMIESILLDKRDIKVASVSTDHISDIKNVSLGLPIRLGKRGIIETLEIYLTPEEMGQLQRSADILTEFC